jgi:hypothetical protein
MFMVAMCCFTYQAPVVSVPKPQIVTIAPAIGLLDGDWCWLGSLDEDKAKKDF